MRLHRNTANHKEDIIDNSSKPLYGRKTASIKLEPFTYRQARQFFPGYSDQEALETYFCLGGVPYYLTLFDDKLSLRENIIKNCFMTTGVLYNEPDTLLRMELIETYFYKNILLAIESGASSLNDIKLKVDSDSAKVSKYLSVLINLGFVEKEMPFYAVAIGRWWGTNPILKKPEEIDILALNDQNALIAECKYTEKPFDVHELNDLIDSAQCIRRRDRYYIFSRKGITEAVADRISGDDHYSVISIKELFE